MHKKTTIMKKYIYIFAAFAAIISCSKEALIDDTTTSIEGQEVHELFVSISDIVDAETKASINETDGKFTWAAGDFVAVKTTTNDIYKFTAASSGNSVRFTYTGTMNGTPAYVKYPYTADFSDTDLPTAIGSLTGALDAANIRMEGAVAANSVTLTHQNALMRVTFTNVPTFANSLVFDGDVNDVTISGISLGSKGSVVAYIPVDDATTSFTVSLMDTNNNVIVERSTSAKTFTAGTLKNMAATNLGSCFMFTGSNKANVVKVKCTQKLADTDSYGSNNYTWTANALANGDKYIVLPDPLVWTWLEEDIDAVRVDVYNGVGDENDGRGTWVAATDNLYLRDITFTAVSAKTALQAAYRYYYSMPDGWSKINIYTWDQNDVKCTGEWPGTEMTQTTNGRYYYEFDSSVSGDNYRHVIFSNNGSSQTANIYRKLTQDFYGNSTNVD